MYTLSVSFADACKMTQQNNEKTIASVRPWQSRESADRRVITMTLRSTQFQNSNVYYIRRQEYDASTREYSEF